MVKKWWEDKVAYQIYPKSYIDSNGDGIGDLKGILSKLDYLKELGADIIWLSPIYCSPLADQGYDISDYYDIDPRFGTMEEMDTLIAEADKRGMKILMDLVVNHCSDEHPWFIEACKDPNGKYGKYFYIRKKDELTNWGAYFGGSVWEQLPGHDDLYYLHMFHKKQPDLNWENPEVREEVYKNMNWWLDKGLGGFRVDAIMNIKKPAVWHDYPSDRADGLSTPMNMIKDAEGIGDFLNEMKDRTLTPHDAFTVGEVFDADASKIHDFIGDHGYFSSMFDFSTTRIGFDSRGWVAWHGCDAQKYIRAIYTSQKAAGNNGFLSNIIENHDEPRGASHYLPAGKCCDEGKKMLGLITVLSRGIPFIYQGQEIGMENMPFESIDQFDDIQTHNQYRTCKAAGLSDEEALKICKIHSRDNCRTPMQWTADPKTAGFTSGTPWLAVNPNTAKINVYSEEKDPDSVLSFYRALTALRKDPAYKDTFVYGDFVPQSEPESEVMAYLRKGENCSILIIGNMSDSEKEICFKGAAAGQDAISIDGEPAKILIANCKDTEVKDSVLKLRPFEAAAILMK